MVSIGLGSRSELYLLHPCYHFNSSSRLASGPHCMISCLWHIHNNAAFMLELRSASYIRIYFLEEDVQNMMQDFLLALLAAVLDG